MICEIFHVIGLGLLAFKIVPELDVVKAAMLTNSVCLVPAILSMLCQICVNFISTNHYIIYKIFSAKALDVTVELICATISWILLPYVLSVQASLFGLC